MIESKEELLDLWQRQSIEKKVNEKILPQIAKIHCGETETDLIVAIPEQLVFQSIDHILVEGKSRVRINLICEGVPVATTFPFEKNGSVYVTTLQEK